MKGWEFTQKDIKFIKNRILKLETRLGEMYPGYTEFEKIQRERRLFVWMLEQIERPEKVIILDKEEYVKQSSTDREFRR